MTQRRLPPSIAFLGTYPPTSCGLATFAFSLRSAVADGRGSEAGLGVVSVVDKPLGRVKDEVAYEHLNGDGPSLEMAIQALNSFDVALIQHEYGIFGGPDGNEVLDLLSGLDIPAIVTLHTVLSQPSPAQKSILERVVALAERTVVMTETAYERLLTGYEVDSAKVRVIPHGARIDPGSPLANGDRPILLTWGLIGPGKGLEMAIEAFAGLGDLRPLPRYVILGKTHPKVQASEGDAYLDGLVAQVHELGLDHVVEFDGRYLNTDELAVVVGTADMVVLPYESTEQVTSGVLVEAIAAGKPVIATAFPHAVELLATGAGIVVPHNDPIALAAAVRKALTDPSLAAQMVAEAKRIGSPLHWPAIARRYERMAKKLVDRHQSARADRAAKRPEVLDGLPQVG